MAMSPHHDNHIVSTRNGIIENTHLIHAAVVDSRGRILLSTGNPHRLTLIRSSFKPAQALAVAESGAHTKYRFSSEDIALSCASHSSEERHVLRARALLAKSNSLEADLRCGGHPSITPAVNNAWIKSGFVATPVFSNCSGKHAAFLAASKALGCPVQGYHSLDHPVQQRVREILQDLTDLPPEGVKWGIDGCNMAAPAIPLDRLALLNAKFARAADEVDSGEDVTPRCEAMGRIFTAMAAHPELVAGEGRFCTLLMGAFGGRLIGKVGADACYGIGVREGDETRRMGAEGAVGIAVKVEDGNMDVLYAAVAEMLDRLRLGSEGERRALDGFRGGRILNTAGVETGGWRFPFTLRGVCDGAYV